MNPLVFHGFAALFVRLALTLAHEIAGLDVIKDGGPFQMREINWGFVENFP